MPNLMAARPNIGGAVCESSVIPFLVLHRKVWLRPPAGVPCSNAANIGERKTWTKWEKPTKYIVPAQQTIKDSAKFGWPPVRDVAAVNEAKTRNRLKFAGVPQTGKPISAVTGSKFAIL